ncbi:hypothetical protein RRG08_012194 [Elysia crispata]|uniref:Uncharacterized protein n=1 Tax=Elysia crispata TaxID=231223 RepID=A0AAE1AJQ7_9GAST|nr:hypothetical protein RRG08_012194 [Elysia crispata]
MGRERGDVGEDKLALEDVREGIESVAEQRKKEWLGKGQTITQGHVAKTHELSKKPVETCAKKARNVPQDSARRPSRLSRPTRAVDLSPVIRPVLIDMYSV